MSALEPSPPFPAATAVTTSAIVLANWQQTNPLIRSLTDLSADASWAEWAVRWPGSFLKASPYFGETTDTLLAAGLIALTMGHTERQEGTARTLKLAVAGQVIGSAATRLAAVGSVLPPDQLHDLDVGSSSVVAALAGNWLTRRLRERHSTNRARALALGVGAIGIAAAGLVDPSATDVISHIVPFAYGVWEGGRKPLATADPVPEAPAAAEVA